MSKKLTQAETARDKARAALREVVAQRNDERDRLLREEEHRIDVEMKAKFGERISALTFAANRAEAEYQQALVEEGLRTAKYPPGTKLCGWKKDRSYYGSTGKWIMAATGIVEVMTPTTEVPKTLKWSKPRIGELVVRVLTKDGKPGKVVQRLEGWRQTWLPEGKKPK